MKMQADDWKNVKHFGPEEFPPRADMMDQSIIFLIDTIREFFNSPIHITSAWAPGTGHSATSQHYVGKAVDFWIEGIPFRDAVDLMEGFIGPVPRGIDVAKKIGLGIYPAWSIPGFHLDTRGEYARWGWIGQYDSKGKMIYVNYDHAKTKIR